MRFLRVSLLSLMILTLVGGSALAETTVESSSGTTAESSGSSDTGSTPSSDSSSDPAESTEPIPDVVDEVYGEPDVIEIVYGLEIKGLVSAVTPAEGDNPGTITVVVDGQPVTFSAADLGLTPESLAMVTVGAEFKLESNDGQIEAKITGESGTVKVEVNADGTIELKLEEAHPGKGQAISEEKKAMAEEHKEEARQKAEEAKQNGKGHEKQAGESKAKGRK